MNIVQYDGVDHVVLNESFDHCIWVDMFVRKEDQPHFPYRCGCELVVHSNGGVPSFRLVPRGLLIPPNKFEEFGSMQGLFPWDLIVQHHYQSPFYSEHCFDFLLVPPARPILIPLSPVPVQIKLVHKNHIKEIQV